MVFIGTGRTTPPWTGAGDGELITARELQRGAQPAARVRALKVRQAMEYEMKNHPENFA